MKALHEQLSRLDEHLGCLMGQVAVHLQPIPGEVPVVQVSIGGREELPIYITRSDTQILCLCYLWSDDDVRPARRNDLAQTLLELNPSVPLSAFGRIGDRYVLTGALSIDATVDAVAQDVAVLSDNALDALDALSDYLV